MTFWKKEIKPLHHLSDTFGTEYWGMKNILTSLF